MGYLISGTSLVNAKSLAGSFGMRLLGLNSLSPVSTKWHIVSRRSDEAEDITKRLESTLDVGTESPFNPFVASSITTSHIDEIARNMKRANATGLVLLPDAIDVHQWSETQTLLAAAKVAELQHLVLISSQSAHPNSILPSGRAWVEIEEIAKESRIPLTILRPTTFMQSFLFGQWFEMISWRNLSVPMDRARISLIDCDDVAKVVHHVLGKPQTTTLTLTGPAALSWEDISSTFNRHLDSPLNLSKVPLWVVQPTMWIRGKNPDQIHEMINLSKYYEAGSEAEVTPTIEEMLGKPPQSFEQFVEQNKDLWPQQS